MALTYPMGSAKEAAQTSIKIFPVSSGSKHRQVEVEHQDEIDIQVYPTNKPESDPENMVTLWRRILTLIKIKINFKTFNSEKKIAIYDDPVLKRPEKNSEESTEKTVSLSKMI